MSTIPSSRLFTPLCKFLNSVNRNPPTQVQSVSASTTTNPQNGNGFKREVHASGIHIDTAKLSASQTIGNFVDTLVEKIVEAVSVNKLMAQVARLRVNAGRSTATHHALDVQVTQPEATQASNDADEYNRFLNENWPALNDKMKAEAATNLRTARNRLSNVLRLQRFPHLGSLDPNPSRIFLALKGIWDHHQMHIIPICENLVNSLPQDAKRRAFEIHRSKAMLQEVVEKLEALVLDGPDEEFLIQKRRKFCLDDVKLAMEHFEEVFRLTLDVEIEDVSQ